MGHDGIGLLFIIGIGLFGGLIGASVFQAMRIPQVVGYIAIGVLAGGCGLGIIDPGDVASLDPFNTFALGIIGFLVGGELHLSTFRRYARQFTAILLGEGIAAFVLVSGAVLILLHIVTGSWVAAIAGAAVFGAIASATDPASTINVLWEYRCKGVLTTSITAIVALDDALAMGLYGLGTATAQIVTGSADSIWPELGTVAMELGGAMLMGAAFGLLLAWVVRFFAQAEKTLAVALGCILLVISISARFHMDVILAAMTLGFVLANVAPRRSESIFTVVRGFAGPIYIMFFVLVGARLSPDGMPWWLWAIVGCYVVGRSVGKMAGAWLGAKLTGAEPVVRRYLGMGLFAQGGVAVGLSILASQHLQHIIIADGVSLGDAIIFGITATTLCVQLIGPALVKLAVKRAGETGRDVTAQDVIAGWTVDQAMRSGEVLQESLPVSLVVDRFSTGDDEACAVVDDQGRLCGIIDFDGLRGILPERDSWPWMLATDLVQEPKLTIMAGQPLAEALERMHHHGSDVAPVLDADQQVVGVLSIQHARERARRACLQVEAA